MRITKEQAQNYFEFLVEHQPETAVEILIKLISREVNVEDWIKDTVHDIIDSEN